MISVSLCGILVLPKGAKFTADDLDKQVCEVVGLEVLDSAATTCMFMVVSIDKVDVGDVCVEDDASVADDTAEDDDWEPEKCT